MIRVQIRIENKEREVRITSEVRQNGKWTARGPVSTVCCYDTQVEAEMSALLDWLTQLRPFRNAVAERRIPE